MSLAIGHYSHGDRKVIIDALRESKPPFSPERVDVTSAHADKWGGDWPKEQFAKFGIVIEPAAKTKHGLFTDFCRASTRSASKCSTTSAASTRSSIWNGATIPARTSSIIRPVGTMTRPTPSRALPRWRSVAAFSTRRFRSLTGLVWSQAATRSSAPPRRMPHRGGNGT
jgi:hypothetical protein